MTFYFLNPTETESKMCFTFPRLFLLLPQFFQFFYHHVTRGKKSVAVLYRDCGPGPPIHSSHLRNCRHLLQRQHCHLTGPRDWPPFLVLSIEPSMGPRTRRVKLLSIFSLMPYRHDTYNDGINSWALQITSIFKPTLQS